MAGVRFALLENKRLSKKTIVNKTFFQVEGTLCGFDPFMNLVLDDSIEFTKQVCQQFGPWFACKPLSLIGSFFLFK